MKKFVNDPKQYVPEMLKGIALANPDKLRYVPEYNLRAAAPARHRRGPQLRGGVLHVLGHGRGQPDLGEW